MHTLKWFLSRIGKRIYRNVTTCTCFTCTDVSARGLVMRDAAHAQYLCDLQGELKIKYRDRK